MTGKVTSFFFSDSDTQGLTWLDTRRRSCQSTGTGPEWKTESPGNKRYHNYQSWGQTIDKLCYFDNSALCLHCPPGWGVRAVAGGSRRFCLTPRSPVKLIYSRLPQEALRHQGRDGKALAEYSARFPPIRLQNQNHACPSQGWACGSSVQFETELAPCWQCRDLSPFCRFTPAGTTLLPLFTGSILPESVSNSLSPRRDVVPAGTSPQTSTQSPSVTALLLFECKRRLPAAAGGSQHGAMPRSAIKQAFDVDAGKHILFFLRTNI